MHIFDQVLKNLNLNFVRRNQPTARNRTRTRTRSGTNNKQYAIVLVKVTVSAVREGASSRALWMYENGAAVRAAAAVAGCGWSGFTSSVDSST